MIRQHRLLVGDTRVSITPEREAPTGCRTMSQFSEEEIADIERAERLRTPKIDRDAKGRPRRNESQFKPVYLAYRDKLSKQLIVHSTATLLGCSVQRIRRALDDKTMKMTRGPRLWVITYTEDKEGEGSETRDEISNDNT